jgi:beta-glucanase (GH16 family)
MKKFLFYTLVCICACAQAQVNVDNFEYGFHTWDAVSSTVGVQTNVYKTGINFSDHVLFANRPKDEVSWAGVICNPYVQSGYRYLHAYMYRNNNGMPNLKVSDTNAQDLAPMNAIVANEWQDVVWDISAYEQTGIEFIFFMVDRNALTEEAWILVDEVQLSNDPTPRTDTVGIPTGKYELVWNEDFTEASLDNAVWNVEVNGDGGGNNELQYYCQKGVTMGVEPQTGKHCLILTATKEDYSGKKCTSGRVNTKNKMYYTYGKIEARIKFPQTANGLWPAFWQMGNNFDEVGWPRCGETDLIELGHQNAFNKGTQDRYFNGAMHVGARWDAVWSEANSVTWPYSVEDTFHIVTMIWTPTSIDMYMDMETHPAEPYFHANLEPNDNPDYDRSVIFGKPNFIIANLAIGGNFPGIQNINAVTALADGPRSMYIDWIRIYQRGDANQSFHSPSPSDPIEPENPQGIEEVMDEGLQVTGRKILRDGQLLIRRGENIYTVTGQMLK